MSSPVLTAHTDWSPGQALGFMKEHSISHLPVRSDGRLSGMVSDRDLLSRPPEAASLNPIMTKRLLTTRPDSNLWLVACTMLAERTHCVLVVDEGCELQGILTSLDILGCMTHHAPFEVWG